MAQSGDIHTRVSYKGDQTIKQAKKDWQHWLRGLKMLGLVLFTPLNHAYN
jgi:hypothetical protein